MKKAFNISFVMALLGSFLLLGLMSFNLGSCKWVHEVLGDVRVPVTTLPPPPVAGQYFVIPTAMAGEVPAFNLNPLVGPQLVVDGEFNDMYTLGTLPARPDANAFNNWNQWNAWINQQAVNLEYSIFPPQGTDEGYGNNSYGEGNSDNKFVTMYGRGNWQAYVEQTILDVQPGLYTAEAKVMLGNHNYELYITATNGANVLGYRRYTVSQASLDAYSDFVRKEWKRILTLVDVPSAQNVKLKIQVEALGPNTTGDDTKVPFARIDDVSFRASPTTTSTTSTTI